MYLGKVVSATSQVDYVCHISGPYEVEMPPAPEDYAFGAFVALEREAGGYLVGAIADTILLNPDYGNLGPRLSAAGDLAVFSPDYLAEKATLAQIIALGAVDAQGQVRQGVPAFPAGVDAPVRTITHEELLRFHRPAATPDNAFRVAYLPLLSSLGRPLIPHLIASILGTLGEAFPAEAARLSVLATNQAWRSRVQPLG